MIKQRKMRNKALFFKTAFIQAGIFVIAFVTTLSCNNDPKPENTKTVAEEHNDAKFSDDKQTNAQFLVNAAEINLEEMEMGKLAQVKSGAADIKEMGKMVEQAHTKSQGELTELANKKMVTIPTSITNKGQADYDKLNVETGTKFDKAFCDMMVDRHKDAISKFEKMSTESSDQDIKDWANATLPILRKHLDNAISCQKRYENM
jgi:putative membrane protein